MIFSKRSHCQLLAAAAILLIVVCGPPTVSAQMKTPPPAGEEQLPFSAPRFILRSADLRHNTASVWIDSVFGTVNITSEDLLEAAMSAVRIELSGHGFRVGPAAPTLSIDPKELNVQGPAANASKKSARAFFIMAVAIEKTDGNVIFRHEVKGEYDENDMKDLSADAAERVANLAIQDCVQQLFADPEFDDALEKAHQP